MPPRARRPDTFDCLFAEASAQLPLFEDLTDDTIVHLSALGFGRGFLTASLRARLRKAGFRDLGHLAQSAPAAIAGVRKFGPVRVERVRAFILDEIARRQPGGRALHAAEATRQRRLSRLRDGPVGNLPLARSEIAAFGSALETCADIAGRSRRKYLATHGLAPGDVDRVVTALARFLGAGRTIAAHPTEGAAGPAATETETEALAARRAALLAERDRDWEAAAPAGDRIRRSRTP